MHVHKMSLAYVCQNMVLKDTEPQEMEIFDELPIFCFYTDLYSHFPS